MAGKRKTPAGVAGVRMELEGAVNSSYVFNLNGVAVVKTYFIDTGLAVAVDTLI
jgi:hypothetical protein